MQSCILLSYFCIHLNVQDDHTFECVLVKEKHLDKSEQEKKNKIKTDAYQITSLDFACLVSVQNKHKPDIFRTILYKRYIFF